MGPIRKASTIGRLAAMTHPRLLKATFGIGCYAFGYIHDLPYEFEPPTYFRAVREALASLPTIDEIQIDEGSQQDPTSTNEPLASVEEGPFFLPLGNFWHIDFRVQILHRLQSPLLDGDPPLTSEKFRVRIESAYHSPVTFVLPEKREEDPSESVRLVREYLRQQLGAHPVTPFQCIGPSPYHMDCYLATADPGKLAVNWTCELEPSIAYDKARFQYSPEIYNRWDDVLDELFHDLAEELCCHYYCVQLDRARMTQWSRVEAALDRVRELERAVEWRGRLRRLWTTRFRLEEAFIDLADFEMASLNDKQELANAYRQIYEGAGRPFFKVHADELLQSRYEPPTRQAADILGLFERRRGRRTDALILILASLLGGAVGGVITTLFAYGR
jgi:hypothetical protein